MQICYSIKSKQKFIQPFKGYYVNSVLWFAAVFILQCLAGTVSGQDAVTVGAPGGPTETTISATLGGSVELICSRSLAWKTWISDMTTITLSSSENILVSGTSTEKLLTITSFASTNTGAYTCGVTEFTSNSPEDVITGAITNYTISISIHQKEMSYTMVPESKPSSMSDSMKEVDSSGSKSTIIEFQPISPSFSSLDELVSRVSSGKRENSYVQSTSIEVQLLSESSQTSVSFYQSEVTEQDSFLSDYSESIIQTVSSCNSNTKLCTSKEPMEEGAWKIIVGVVIGSILLCLMILLFICLILCCAIGRRRRKSSDKLSSSDELKGSPVDEKQQTSQDPKEEYSAFEEGKETKENDVEDPPETCEDNEKKSITEEDLNDGIDNDDPESHSSQPHIKTKPLKSPSGQNLKPEESSQVKNEDPEQLYSKPDKVDKSPQNQLYEPPADKAYEPLPDRVAESECPTVPPQTADMHVLCSD